VSPKSRLGDRREHLRFNATGQLWASLNFGERVVLRNLATGGALVEATLTSTSRPIRTAHISLPGDGPGVDAVVRHVSPVADSARGSDRYLVGLEFVGISASERADIERLVCEWQERPAP
jgi:hypothetical protein